MGSLIILTDADEPQKPAVTEPQPPASNTPGDVLKLAIERGADVDQLERLLNLELRWRMYQAELAYQQDFLAFKQEPGLKILKDEIVDFTSKRTGERTNYTFSPLDKAEVVLIPLLAKHNFTHHWRTEPQANGWTKVTAVIKHVLCHENAGASLAGPPDNSGAKNPHQAIGSNTSYLERYTLCAACGITPRRVDTDANLMSAELVPATPVVLERNEPNLTPILKESVAEVKAKKEIERFAGERQRLQGATTLEDLMKGWAAIGKEARKALVEVKDQKKRELEAVCK